jgi:hypothetical protein
MHKQMEELANDLQNDKEHSRKKLLPGSEEILKKELNMKLLQDDPRFGIDNLEFEIRDCKGVIVQIGQEIVDWITLHFKNKSRQPAGLSKTHKKAGKRLG